MKGLICLLALSASGCIATNPATTVDSAGPKSALVRVAITVKDLDASKEFYGYVLGFEPGFDGDITSPWVTGLLQLEQSQTVRFAILKGADSVAGEGRTSATIGLLEVQNSGTSCPASAGRREFGCWRGRDGDGDDGHRGDKYAT